MAKKQCPLPEARDTFEPLKGVKSVLEALKDRVRASTDILEESI